MLSRDGLFKAMIGGTFLMTLLAAPAAGAAGSRVAVKLLDVPEAYRPSERAMQILVESALQKHGLEIVQLPAGEVESPGSQPTEDPTSVDRLFEVSFVPIGNHHLVLVTEKDPRSKKKVFSAQERCGRVEELERILPRLTEAVLRRGLGEPDRESTPRPTPAPTAPAAPEGPRKLQSRIGMGASLLMGSLMGDLARGVYGAKIYFAYEMKQLRLIGDVGGSLNDDFGFFDMGVRVSYLFMDRDITPYVGIGVGLHGLTKAEEDSMRFETKWGAAGSASFGLEFFRNYSLHLLVEGEFYFPFSQREKTTYVEGKVQSIESKWTPTGVFKIGLLFI